MRIVQAVLCVSVLLIPAVAHSLTVTYPHHTVVAYAQQIAPVVSEPANIDSATCVILLHGLMRTAKSMRAMEKYLNAHGYLTVNRNYPSTSQSIEQLSNTIIPEYIDSCKKPAQKIHFVTHSLGGIILRHYLQTNSLPQDSRIVMLAPPNKGSEVPDFFKDWGLYKWLTGIAGQQLTTESHSIPNTLKPIHYEIGVIAGRQTINPWFSYFIVGPDDGIVSIESTRLPEMQDFIIVDHIHSFIMYGSKVKQQTLHFLQHGRFNKISPD